MVKTKSLEKTKQEIDLEELLFAEHVPLDFSETVEEEDDVLPLVFDTDEPSSTKRPHPDNDEAPKWHDEQDDVLTVNLTNKNVTKKLRLDPTETTISVHQYSLRLKQQFEKIHGTPEWAKIPQNGAETSSADSMEFLRTSFGVKAAKSFNSTLDAEFLDVVRLKDANIEEYSQVRSQYVLIEWRLICTGCYPILPVPPECECRAHRRIG